MSQIDRLPEKILSCERCVRPVLLQDEFTLDAQQFRGEPELTVVF